MSKVVTRRLPPPDNARVFVDRTDVLDDLIIDADIQKQKSPSRFTSRIGGSGHHRHELDGKIIFLFIPLLI